MLLFDFYYQNWTSKREPLPWCASRDLLDVIAVSPHTGNYLPNPILSQVRNILRDPRCYLFRHPNRDYCQYFIAAIDRNYYFSLDGSEWDLYIEKV